MTTVADIIYHVTDRAIPDGAGEHYTCASLETEGFIHCCTKEQLAGVLDRYYRGVPGLRLLTISVNSLDAKLVFENTVGGEELFPHVYGPINMSAVVDVSGL